MEISNRTEIVEGASVYLVWFSPGDPSLFNDHHLDIFLVITRIHMRTDPNSNGISLSIRYSSMICRCMWVHPGRKLYGCQHRDRTFNLLHCLKWQFFIHIEENPRVYQVCDKNSNRGGYLEAGTQFNEKPFLCQICDIGFNRSHNLKKHLRVHAGEKQYKCQHCERSFNLPHSLKRHSFIHIEGISRHNQVLDISSNREGYLEEGTQSGGKPFLCQICDIGFNRSHNLKKHLRAHARGKQYKCQLCEKSFNLPHSLKRHSFIHFEGLPTYHQVCDKSSNREEYLKAGTQSGEKPFLCQICDIGFNRPHNLKKHLRVHAGGKQYKCQHCERSFNLSHSLKRHSFIHIEGIPRHNQVCDIISNRGGYLEEGTQSGGKPFLCQICNIGFNRSHNLKKHSRAHARGKQYKCQHCEKSFNLPHSLKRHSFIHFEWLSTYHQVCDKSSNREEYLKAGTQSGEKPFLCQICDIGFNRPHNLKKHLRVHAGGKQFKCQHCERSFNLPHSLKRHSFIHIEGIPRHNQVCDIISNRGGYLEEGTQSGGKPFLCQICDIGFNRSHNLKKHLRAHARGKQYKCQHCEKSFNLPHSLKRHSFIHFEGLPTYHQACDKSSNREEYLKAGTQSGEKPFLCQICDIGFNRPHNLKKHLRVHAGGKQYECQHCERSFNLRHSLKRHSFIHIEGIPRHNQVCDRSFNRGGY